MLQLYRGGLPRIGDNRKLCSGRYPPKGQVQGPYFRNYQISGRLINALNAVNRGNLANIHEDGFQLAAVHNFQAGIDARVDAVWAADQVADVRTSFDNHGGDVSKQSGAIARTNLQLDGESRGILATPFNSDAALRLVKQILHVGARAGVHRDAAAARDVPDYFITGNGIAALRAIDQQIVMPFDDKRRFAETQHAFDGFNQRGLGVGHFNLRGLGRLTKHAGQNLARGILSKAYRGIQIVNLRKAVIGGHLQHVRFRNFLQAAIEVARFIFKQLAPHLGGFLALFEVDPMANFALRVGTFYEAQPVAVGVMALLSENLHDIATGDFMTQRDHLAVYLRAGTLMPNFCVHGIREIHRRGPARQLQHATLGSEGINLHWGEIDL